MSKSDNEILHDAKLEESADDVIVLSTGVRARVKAVSGSLLDTVLGSIDDPDVPMWFNEDKDRNEPNPSDPEYIKACLDANSRRGRLAMEAMVIFGIDLVDGVPEDNDWVERLKYISNLSGKRLEKELDFDDPMDREIAYKKYIAVGSDDMVLISQKSGVSREDAEKAYESFQGDEK